VLHGARVEPSVGLSPRSSDSRAFASIEDPELDSPLIGYAAHKSVQGIYLTHQVSLAEPANCRVAGHGSDGCESMRNERGLCAHPSCRGRRLAARVSSADYNHVKVHSYSSRRLGFIRYDLCSKYAGLVSRETLLLANTEIAEDDI
jgi:hypothetical protein